MLEKTKCLVCEQTEISPFQFHCAHVIAKCRNGTCDVSNLRPICSVCNQSMGSQNMMEFAQKFHPKSRVHQTFKTNKENKAMQQTIEIINTPRKRVIKTKNLNDVDFKQVIKSAMESSLLSCDDQKVHNNEYDQTNIGSQDLLKNKKIICQYCQKKFARRDNLTRHINKNYCKVLRAKTWSLEYPQNPLNQNIDNNSTISDLKQTVSILVDEIAKLKEIQISMSFEKRIADL